MDMDTQNYRPDHGRAALAADLVATLLDQLPAGHPARATARELEKLFGRRTTELRGLIDRVPGRSLTKKAERIGISKQTLWALWHGKFVASMEILTKIEAAAAAAEEDA